MIEYELAIAVEDFPGTRVKRGDILGVKPSP